MKNYILIFILGFTLCGLCWSVSIENFWLLVFNTFLFSGILAYFCTKLEIPLPK